MYKQHNHAVYGRDKHVTNWGQNLDKCDKFFDQSRKPLVLLGFRGVKKVTKFVPCDKNCDKNGTKRQNIHFMHKKCIKIRKM